jgi:GT2 family glycosyltransferase
MIHQLIHEKNKIIKKDVLKLNSSQKDVAILFHVFYIDIWKEIKNYLDQLNISYDLYITIPESMKDKDIISIFSDHPNVTIYRTENRGRDVLPFLQVMNIIGVDTYKYICKLHTKKTGNSPLGQTWRKLLYFDLLGSQKLVNDIITLFDNDDSIGIVTGKNTILDSERYAYGNSEKIDLLAKKLDIIYDQNYLFPAGTMFWIRASLLRPMVDLFINNQLEFEEEKGQKDDTLAHAIERFFGIMAQANKQKIAPSPSDYSELSRETLDELANLVLGQQYAGKDMFMAQKSAIEEKDGEIAYLIDVAESMRLKNRVKNITNKIVPLCKKLAKIPNKAIKIIKVVKNNPALLKKVFYYAKRGELGYLITKIREKSSTNLRKSDNLQEVAIADYFIDLDKRIYTMSTTPIDIIIPVYNGYEFLEPLFDSIEEHTSSPYRLIVVNDCSPDEKVKPYLLKRLKKHPTALFIDHTQNQGFLKSVNEAYTHTKNHFVLLNTDTEVPSFWLERLMYPILHMDNIASTTPFTNSGEIASFPNFVADNDIFDAMSVEDLDSNFKTVNPNKFYAEVPTGVGFCMGVNADLAKKIGMFAEDTFGKGYGEENDWCQRAIQEGYKNLIVPNLFVYHKHGGSFTAEEKQKLLQKNAVTLLERHPNYSKDVNKYLEENPHEVLRHLLVLKASNQTHDIHLVFDHFLGGGANIYTQERIEQYLKEGKNTLLIAYDHYSHCYILRHRYKNYDFSFKITDFEALTQFINRLQLAEIFINNFVSYKNPHTLLSYIDTLVDDSSAKLVLPIHDFYTLCPSYNLLNEEGKYCDVPDIEKCATCMDKNMQEWRNFYNEEVDVKQWRASWEKLFNKSNEILFFSNSSKEIFLKAYPTIDSNKLIVTPHTVTDISPLNIHKNPNKTTTTIGILGAISYVKGSHIIKQMIQLIERDNLDINVVVIGEITETISSEHFKSTGKYRREDLPQIIKDEQIDIFLIPSIWPETFSYTAQEVMMMELPLMVFDLGAPAERVKKYTKGIIINEISAAAVLNTVQKV